MYNSYATIYILNQSCSVRPAQCHRNKSVIHAKDVKIICGMPCGTLWYILLDWYWKN